MTSEQMLNDLRKIANLGGAELLRLQNEVLISMKEDGPLVDKGAGDFATQADLSAEKIISEQLLKLYPNIPLVAEESFQASSQIPSTYFTIDPLDGTLIYSRGCTDWGSTICFVENGLPQIGVIVFPALRTEVWAFKGKGCFLSDSVSSERRVKVKQLEPDEKFILAVDTFYHSTSNEISDILLPLVEKKRILVSRALGAAVPNILGILRGEIDAYYCGRAKIWDVAAGALAIEEAGGAIFATSQDSMDWQTLAKGQVFAANALLAKEVGQLARETFRRHG